LARHKSPFSKEELAYLRSTHTLIATPCYGEMCSSNYMRSVVSLFEFAAEQKIPLGLQTIGNESLITRARNQMVFNFMELEHLTHLMFIDADISFNPVDVFKLITSQERVSCSSLSYEGYCMGQGFGAKTVEEARRNSLDYVINLPPEIAESKEVKEKGSIDVKLYNGLLEVYDAGTGFMLISRFTIQALIDNYGDEVSIQS
jgi:hypothetical protein